MRRALLSVLAVFVLAALSASTAAAREQGRFASCPRELNGLRNNPAIGVFDIEVRDVSCTTAYNDIENLPGALSSRMRYRSYTCRYTFSPASDLFEFVCTDGRRAYKFAAAGE